MRKSVLVIIASISRRSGGISSALDLIEAFNILGYKVNVGVAKYPPSIYRFYNSNFLKLALSKIKFLDNRLVKNPFKSRIRSVYSIFNFGKISEDDFNKYDYVIDISVLNERLVSNFRNDVNTIFVKNHAGSVESYKKSFSNNEEESKKSYLESFKSYDRILFQSKTQSLECISEFNELEGKQIVIEPSCEEESVLRSQFSSPPYLKNKDKINLVNVGSLQKRKGQVLSVRLLHELIKSDIKCELHLVGGIIDENYLTQINKVSEDLGVAKFLFVHGHKDNYLDYMAHSDIILQTSYSEGVSRILREAMLMEKPIATFSISGTNDLLDNDCAILATPFVVEDLANKIKAALKDNNKLNNLKQNALNEYKNNNSRTAYYKNILSTFK